jgi:glycosyltransferase involved in cell wall biosynthesis
VTVAPKPAIRVLVVAEYYPRAGDPTSGIWTHLQALAARRAGAEIRVLVLYRPLPPLAAVRALDLSAVIGALRQPPTAQLDGLPVDYMRYLSPPRPWSYPTWGAWAAPWLRRALSRIRGRFPFDLVHAHYAIPAADAVRRAAPDAPLVVSVHGHDVYGPQSSSPQVRAALSHASLVLANTAGTARRSVASGAAEARTHVVHLGSDLPSEPATVRPQPQVLVSVGNLIERKRHADVIAALAILRDRHCHLRYVIVGDGPERERLRRLAASLGVLDAVDLRGRLEHEQAVAVARSATVFVLPSVDEAFGVSYVEAMAAGVPAIGSAGEDGPAEIERCGGGIELVAPHDPPALAAAIDALLDDPRRLEATGRAARETVRREFTWDQCGRRTVDAYAAALRR